jgi:choloylglycine hydrolase
MKKTLTTLCCALISCLTAATTDACTRALYHGSQNTVITGRSMDWNDFTQTDLWVFPRGIKRSGQAGANSPEWTAKYGSVIATIYGIASVDGMNEKGLVMNLLYLAESDYGKPSADHPSISISLWGQYALDNFATVAEAVTAMEAKPFYISSFNLPNGRPATAHLSLSDSSGDSAIFEYIDGKLVIHHGSQFSVMTNSPIYSKQLALDEYWQSIGGTVFLPGTNRASDRYARAQFFIDAIPKTADKSVIQGVPNQQYANQAVASVLSVIRSVSVPIGLTTPGQPNIATTLWRTVADQKNMNYFYDSATTPNTFWISFAKLNFKEGSPVLKLPLNKGEVYSGEVSKELQPTESFKFQ